MTRNADIETEIIIWHINLIKEGLSSGVPAYTMDACKMLKTASSVVGNK